MRVIQLPYIIILYFNLANVCWAQDLSGYKKMAEEFAISKESLVSNAVNSGIGLSYTTQDGKTISATEALNFKGTDIPETSYANENIYNLAQSKAEDPNNDLSKTIQESFIKAEEFETSTDDNFLNKAWAIQSNPEEVVNFISNKYSDCKLKPEEVFENNLQTCDEYTNFEEKSCLVGRKVKVQSAHEYICEKNRKIFNKVCKKKLNLSCNKLGGGIVPKNTTSDLRWEYNYPYLTIGNGHSYWGVHCLKYNYSTNFEIKEKELVEEFVLTNVTYDDYIRVLVNGTQVFIGPFTGSKLEVIGGGRVDTGHYKRSCEQNTVWRTSPNIDLKPYLVEGINTITLEGVVTGGGNGSVIIKVKENSCKEWKEVWEEECKEVGK